MFRRAKYKRTVVLPAAKTIQRVYRGWKGRQRYQRIKQEYFVNFVQIPAVTMMQRIVRGYFGRKLALQTRRELAAALTIQEACRKYRARCRWAFVWQVRFENRMASRIGAVARGYLARQVYKRELRKVCVRKVVIPAVKTIQRVYRGHRVRKQLEDLRDRIEAATVLQYFWRKKKREGAERAKWQEMFTKLKLQSALVIQCAIRCYLARQEVQTKRLKQRGEYSDAALKVQSAWRSFCNRTSIKHMRELMVIEVFARKLTQVKDNLDNVQFDLIDAKADMALLTKHKKKALQQIHDIKQMRLDWELRVPELDKELAAMTRQDIERGWQEAFETEKIVIHFSRLLSAEEILSKKQQIREYDGEMATLKVECEDLERDLEEKVLDETMLLEDIRRLEMQRAAQQYVAASREAIRRQKLRWKVHSNRAKIIQRRKAVEVATLARSLAPPPTSVSYANVTATLKETQALVQNHQDAEEAAMKAQLELRGSRNPHLFAAADAVVAECHQIIKSGSLAMNIVRTDIRDDPTAMCAACGHAICVCHMIKSTHADKVPVVSQQSLALKTNKSATLGRRRRHNRHTDGLDESNL
ncbi:unnamed protein product [Aphanomyces euteiches]